MCAWGPSSIAYSTGTYYNAAANSCEIQCTSSGRRLEEGPSSDDALSLITAPENEHAALKEFMSAFLTAHHLAAGDQVDNLSTSFAASLADWMDGGEPDFGQPALAKAIALRSRKAAGVGITGSPLTNNYNNRPKRGRRLQALGPHSLVASNRGTMQCAASFRRLRRRLHRRRRHRHLRRRLRWRRCQPAAPSSVYRRSPWSSWSQAW